MKRLLKKIYHHMRGYVQQGAADPQTVFLNSGMIPWTTGYSEYKYEFISNFLNSKELDAFRSGTLPKGYGYRLDERAVEYPWFFSRLKNSETVLLDAGSVLNFPQILTVRKLKERKLYIMTLSYEGMWGVVPSPSYIYGDLRDTCFKDSLFDAVCCISTLEHVGMNNTLFYTSDSSKREDDKDAYVAVMKELARILRKGGRLFVTVPYGKHTSFGWFQIFNAEMLSRLIEAFAPSSHEITFFKYENDQWNFSDQESCKSGNYFDINTNKNYEKDYLAASRCIACTVMTK